MVKRIFACLLCLLVIMSVGGCSKEQIGDSSVYNYVTDCQITKTYYSSDANIAKCETGYYVLASKYLFFFDAELKVSTPLCVKPNCLHDNDNCSVAIGVVDQIAYNNEKIYYIESAGEEKEFEGSYITALSADGSKKEHLYYFKETCVDWIVHRGYFYFSVYEYDKSNIAEMGQEINRDAYIYRIPLDKSTDEREVVYYAKHVSGDSQIDELMAFGDYLYFIVTGNTKENNEFVFESYKQDLKDFSLERLCIENGIELMTPSLIDDKLIFASSKEKDGEYQYYITDFNGNNPEPFCWVHEDDKLISDGKYIYIGKDVYYMEDDTQRTMTVYDAKMNKVDDIDLGSGSVTTWRFLPVDDKLFLFGGKQDAGKYVVFYYDKSVIGSLNGEKWDYTVTNKTNG